MALLAGRSEVKAKPVKAPGVRDHGAVLSDSLDELPADEARDYASAVGIALYLAIDRFDIQYVVRLLSQYLSAPRKLDMLELEANLAAMEEDEGSKADAPSETTQQGASTRSRARQRFAISTALITSVHREGNAPTEQNWENNY